MTSPDSVAKSTWYTSPSNPQLNLIKAKRTAEIQLGLNIFSLLSPYFTIIEKKIWIYI